MARGFLLAGVAALAGCSGTLTPPDHPARPATVYLCDYGYHSSLLLPVGRDGTYVEYLFGDWDWAAMNDTGGLQAIRAMAFSRATALGRRYTYDPPPDAVPCPSTVPQKQVPLIVDGDRCDRLQRSLDARWSTHLRSAVYTGLPGGFYVYVKDDAPYGLSHNCNIQVADWLDQLGCTTHGWPVLSHFSVEPERRE